MAKLTDTEIATTVGIIMGGQISKNGNTQIRPTADTMQIWWWKPIKSPVLFNAAGIPGPGYGEYKTEVIDKDKFERRQILATSIIIAESNGYTDARCWAKGAVIPSWAYVSGNARNGNAVGTLKPGQSINCNGQGKGNDRGLCQWNSNAWPGIPDTFADNPDLALVVFWHVSEGFTNFQPWRLSKGILPTSAAYARAKAAVTGIAGEVIDETDVIDDTVTAAAGGVVDGVKDAVKSIMDWTDELAKLLHIVQDGAFWRRVGIGALGVGLIAGSLTLIARSTAIKSILPS